MTMPRPAHSHALAKLKACVVLLVVLHHTILAYCRDGYFDRTRYLWSSAPIVDRNRWIGFDLIVDFNDVYFMSLMFLLSGLFVLPSLARKGVRHYLRGRVLRLGLPFAVAVTLVMPIAYYPSYRQTGADISLAQFWSGYFTAYGWSPGPAWFISLLLIFDAIAALVAQHWPALTQKAATVPDWLIQYPRAGLGSFLAASCVAYLSMRFAFSPGYWLQFGPFAAQASRLLLYATFFTTGAIIGSAGTSHKLLQRTGPIAGTWAVWAGLALVAFAALVKLQLADRQAMLSLTDPVWRILFGVLFVLTCVFTSLALIGGFIRYLDTNRRWLDLLAPCAFGIYLVHYALITWTQTALLTLDISAIAKAVTVFAITLLVCWSLIAFLRQNRVLRQIL